MTYYKLSPSQIEDLGGLVKNSINLIVGPQGCGKTYLMDQLTQRHGHQFDEVYHVAPRRTLSDYPTHSVEEMDEWLQKCDMELEERRKDVNTANGFVAMLRHPDLGIELPRELPKVLSKYRSVHDIERVPSRLLCIDDFGGHVLFKSPNSMFSRMARQLRHIGITSIICCHNIRDVSPAIRSYTSAVNLYGGVPYYDLKEIYQNKGVRYPSYREFINAYNAATTKQEGKAHPFMYLTFLG